MTEYTIKVPDDLDKQFKVHARDRAMSVEQAIVEAMKEALEESGPGLTNLRFQRH